MSVGLDAIAADPTVASGAVLARVGARAWARPGAVGARRDRVLRQVGSIPDSVPPRTPGSLIDRRDVELPYVK
jgi:hypothetical protein